MSKQIRKVTVNSSQQRINSEVRNVTVDQEKRTVELTWSKGTRGMRRSMFGSYQEELEISERAIKLERLNNAAPLLDSHKSMDIDNVIGVVERAWIDGDEAKAIVRFASDEKSDRIFRKVVDGILKNVSVGYSVERYEDVSTDEDEVPVYRATSWEPMEISIVPIGFDRHAQLRSNEVNQEIEIEVINKNKENIEEQSSKENRTMDPKELEALKQAEAAKAVEAERARCLEIRKIVKDAGLDDEIANEYITRDQSIDQVKMNVALFRKYHGENEAARVQPTTSTSTSTTAESQSERREAIIESLLHRVDSRNFSLTERAKPFAGQSLMRILELHLGRGAMESDVDFVHRTMTTSDLPYILSNVANKSAQKRYELAPKTFEAWTTKGTLKDYKEAMQVRGGDIGELKPMTEKGEYQESNLGEERETAQLTKYGVKHSFSDIMIINDDLGLIMQIAQEAGVAQARLDNRLAYQALLSNPLMSDGNAVFSSAHANLLANNPIGEASFEEAYRKMRTQKTVDGRDFLNNSPKFLLVGPTQEKNARKFLATIQPNASADVNIYSNSVQLIVDAEISNDNFYFIADPQLIEGVKVNRLAGRESVKVDSRVNWEDDSIELKLSYAVQAKAMDHRGLVKGQPA